MQKALEAFGFLILVAGLAGVVNHFWSQWRLFNVVNGVLLRRFGTLQPYELYVELIVAALGLVVLLATASAGPDHA